MVDQVSICIQLKGDCVTDSSFSILRSLEARRVETPNAAMTTLASPTLGGSTNVCLWRVEFTAGASGPDHIMDTEQVWHLEHGEMRCEIEGTEVSLCSGDSLRLPGGVVRRFHASTAASFIVTGLPGAVATTPGNHEGVIPAWIR